MKTKFSLESPFKESFTKLSCMGLHFRCTPNLTRFGVTKKAVVEAALLPPKFGETNLAELGGAFELEVRVPKDVEFAFHRTLQQAPSMDLPGEFIQELAKAALVKLRDIAKKDQLLHPLANVMVGPTRPGQLLKINLVAPSQEEVSWVLAGQPDKGIPAGEGYELMRSLSLPSLPGTLILAKRLSSLGLLPGPNLLTNKFLVGSKYWTHRVLSMLDGSFCAVPVRVLNLKSLKGSKLPGDGTMLMSPAAAEAIHEAFAELFLKAGITPTKDVIKPIIFGGLFAKGTAYVPRGGVLAEYLKLLEEYSADILVDENSAKLWPSDQPVIDGYLALNELGGLRPVREISGRTVVRLQTYGQFRDGYLTQVNKRLSEIDISELEDFTKFFELDKEVGDTEEEDSVSDPSDMLEFEKEILRMPPTKIERARQQVDYIFKALLRKASAVQTKGVLAYVLPQDKDSEDELFTVYAGREVLRRLGTERAYIVRYPVTVLSFLPVRLKLDDSVPGNAVKVNFRLWQALQGDNDGDKCQLVTYLEGIDLDSIPVPSKDVLDILGSIKVPGDTFTGDSLKLLAQQTLCQILVGPYDNALQARLHNLRHQGAGYDLILQDEIVKRALAALQLSLDGLKKSVKLIALTELREPKEPGNKEARFNSGLEYEELQAIRLKLNSYYRPMQNRPAGLPTEFSLNDNTFRFEEVVCGSPGTRVLSGLAEITAGIYKLVRNEPALPTVRKDAQDLLENTRMALIKLWNQYTFNAEFDGGPDYRVGVVSTKRTDLRALSELLPSEIGPKLAMIHEIYSKFGVFNENPKGLIERCKRTAFMLNVLSIAFNMKYGEGSVPVREPDRYVLKFARLQK